MVVHKMDRMNYENANSMISCKVSGGARAANFLWCPRVRFLLHSCPAAMGSSFPLAWWPVSGAANFSWMTSSSQSVHRPWPLTFRERSRCARKVDFSDTFMHSGSPNDRHQKRLQNRSSLNLPEATGSAHHLWCFILHQNNFWAMLTYFHTS